MNIFEIHFNPHSKIEEANSAFDTFCFEPVNQSEKKVGNLYMLGELKNILPQNSKLLSSIAKVIKEKFYASPIQTPEKALENSFKSTNEFLASEISKENISWLGNLHFAILNIKEQSKKSLRGKKVFILNCAKIGTIKILLLRNKQITDIGKNLDHKEDPYPLKIFTNVISGNLHEGDKIIILSKDIFDYLSRENILKKLSRIESFDENQIRKIINIKDKELEKISGPFIFIDTENKKLENSQIITFNRKLEKELEEFKL